MGFKPNDPVISVYDNGLTVEERLFRLELLVEKLQEDVKALQELIDKQ